MRRFLLTAFMVLAFAMMLQVNASAEESQMTTVSEGTIYWECSQEYGNYNIINDDNPYINRDRSVIINGWAILNLEDNQILDSFYEDFATVDIELPTIPDGAYLMVHIRGVLPDRYTRLGWIKFSDCQTAINDKPVIEEQTSEEKVAEEFIEIAKKTLKEGVKQDQEAGQQTVVVFDCSGSMAEYMQQVFYEVEELKDEKSPIYLYAFGTYVSEAMRPEELTEEKWNQILQYQYGALSNIVGGILKSTKENQNSHVYLLTDMMNNEGIWEETNFTGKITIIRYGDYIYNYFYDEITTNFSNATIEIIEAE